MFLVVPRVHYWRLDMKTENEEAWAIWLKICEMLGFECNYE